MSPARRAPRPSSKSVHEAVRALAPVSDRMGDELTPERMAEIRARIAAGAYNSREVAEMVAARLMESGDL